MMLIMLLLLLLLLLVVVYLSLSLLTATPSQNIGFTSALSRPRAPSRVLYSRTVESSARPLTAPRIAGSAPRDGSSGRRRQPLECLTDRSLLLDGHLTAETG